MAASGGTDLQGSFKIPKGLDLQISNKDILDVAYKTKLLNDQLQYLFLQLGIDGADIENAKRIPDTRDFKLQSVQVLRSWRQGLGMRATRMAIVQALEMCGLIDAKEILTQKWTCSSQGTASKRPHEQAFHPPTSTEERQYEHQHENEVKRQKIDFDLEAVKRQLKAQYRATKGKMMLLPGLPDISANMNDLFVDLDISVDNQPPGVTPTFIDSYDDLFSIEQQQEDQPDEESAIVKRILVKGEPGVGKSTIVSKLAYDWACGKQHSYHMSRFQLLFVLTINDIRTNTDLISVIQDQLLPDVSGEGLHQYIQSNASSVAILLDGYDEATVHFDKCKTIQNMLRSKSLAKSCMIVTTRPKQVTKFCRKYGSYLQVEVTGFSNDTQQMYVERFMKSKQKASEFFSCCLHAPVDFTAFLCVPITLMMLCSLWIENQKLPSTITALYNAVMSYFADHAHAKTNSDDDEDDDLDRSGVQDWLQKVLGNIGKVALQGLFNDRLVFDSDDFEKAALDEACSLGVVSLRKEQSRSKVWSKVTFLHKTFQEMCAAHYLAKLAKSESHDDFKRYLKQVVNVNVFEMEHLLRFACGLSVQAAHLILPHVVQILYGHYKFQLQEKQTLYGECQEMALFLLHETEVNNPQIGHCNELHASLKPLFKTVWLEGTYRRKLGIKGSIEDIIHSYVISQQQHGRNSRVHSWLQDVESVIYPKINVLLDEEDLNLLYAMSGMSALRLGERHGNYYDITEFLDHLASKNFSVTSLSELHFYHAIFDPDQLASFISALPSHSKLAIYNCTLKEKSSDLVVIS